MRLFPCQLEQEIINKSHLGSSYQVNGGIVFLNRNLSHGSLFIDGYHYYFEIDDGVLEWKWKLYSTVFISAISVPQWKDNDEYYPLELSHTAAWYIGSGDPSTVRVNILMLRTMALLEY